jgi:hypothetical protein
VDRPSVTQKADRFGGTSVAGSTVETLCYLADLRALTLICPHE